MPSISEFYGLSIYMYNNAVNIIHLIFMYSMAIWNVLLIFTSVKRQKAKCLKIS